MRFFKSIKQNEIKESKELIQQKVTSKDLHEQHKKAMNRYQRHLKEYDEEKTQEKYNELIEVHTEIKELEKKIQDLGPVPNELTDDDFDIKHEDINKQEETPKELLPEEIKEKIEMAEEIFKQAEEQEIIPEIIHENNSNTEPEEEMITGDDGITRPKSMHDQIESNKCLFCEEKFGFTHDWNIHMMQEHAEQLIEYNKTEIKKSEDPDLDAIQQLMNEQGIDTKEKYDDMMNNMEKNSPYAIQNEQDPIKEIVEKLEILKKPIINTESIVDLPEIIIKPKKKFDISSMFKKKKFSKLRGIEAYCNICKHTVQQHEYQGKSEGCVKCGCLKTVQDILEINEVDLKYGEKEEIIDNGITCVCGHSQLTHKEQIKFCEVEDCHCVRFRTK